MSNMLKCPNPSCPYNFDPSQVPVGVVLSCPRCAMQFTLGAPAPLAPTSQTAALPSHQPAAPGYPTEPEFGASGRAAPPPPRQERSGRHPTRERERGPEAPEGRRTNKTQVFLLAGIAAVLMAGTALAIIFKLMRRGDTVSTDTLSRLKDLNVGIETPPSGWVRDDNMRVKLGSPYVLSYRRENPEAYMAFGATEPGKGRSPRVSEMQTDLMQAFPKVFDISSVEKQAPHELKWLGEPISPHSGFKFRAQTPSDGLSWAGEAYAVSHKGIAYYWLSWCEEREFEGLKSQFDAFRGKFKILELRKDWKETQSNVIDFNGDKASYTISDVEEVWRETSTADFTPTEPDLDKRLRINLTPKRDRKAIPDEAELRVHLLDSAGDPLQAARHFVEDKETKRITVSNPDLQPPAFEELTDKAQGDPIVAEVYAGTPVVRLRSKITNSSDSSRLIVASGLKVGDKIVVVHCWCEYKKRDTFETKFVQIASSLRSR